MSAVSWITVKVRQASRVSENQDPLELRYKSSLHQSFAKQYRHCRKDPRLCSGIAHSALDAEKYFCNVFETDAYNQLYFNVMCTHFALITVSSVQRYCSEAFDKSMCVWHQLFQNLNDNCAHLTVWRQRRPNFHNTYIITYKSCRKMTIPNHVHFIQILVGLSRHKTPVHFYFENNINGARFRPPFCKMACHEITMALGCYVARGS